MKGFSEYLKIKIHICVGGKKLSEDIKIIKGIHVISGTPGRIYDMIKRNILNVSSVKLFIIDEADEVLSKGLKIQLYGIYRHLPSISQTLLVSATMPNEVVEVTTKLMSNPLKILVQKDQLTLDGIKQYYILVQQEQYKFHTLCDLYYINCITKCNLL